MVARLPERLQGVNEVVQAHVGVIGKLGMRVQGPKNDQVVSIVRSPQKITRIREINDHFRRIIGVFRVLIAESLYLRIDLYRID